MTGVRRIKEGSAAHEALEQQETIDMTTFEDANQNIKRVLSITDDVEYIIERHGFDNPEKAFRSGPRSLSDD